MRNDFERLWSALLLCYESCPTPSAWARSKCVCVYVCVCVLGGGCGRDNWLLHLVYREELQRHHWGRLEFVPHR